MVEEIVMTGIFIVCVGFIMYRAFFSKPACVYISNE